MKSKKSEKGDSKAYFNQSEHPELLRPGNPRNQFIIMMKQMEEMERVHRAMLQVLIEMVPEKKKKSLIYQVRDLLDDGKLNDSME